MAIRCRSRIYKKICPEWAKEKAAYCDDNDELWVNTVWMYVEWNNHD